MDTDRSKYWTSRPGYTVNAILPCRIPSVSTRRQSIQRYLEGITSPRRIIERIVHGLRVRRDRLLHLTHGKDVKDVRDGSASGNDETAVAEYSDMFRQDDTDSDERRKQQGHNQNMVNHYYDLVTDFYESVYFS